MDKGMAVVRCEYQEKELVKAIGDYKFDKARKVWLFPRHKLIDIMDMLKIDSDAETLSVYDELRKEREDYHQKLNVAERIKSGMLYNKQAEDDFIRKYGINPGLLEGLYIHQLKGVELGAMFGSYAFFYEPGCGKTAIAIKLIQHFRKPAMVIAPLSTLENVWIKEIQKFSKLKAVVLWQNLKAFDKPSDVYLINYEHFKKLHQERKDISDKIGVMVIDESQKIRDPKSQITKTIMEFRDKIEHKFCLSGTPNPNDMMEFWGQMAFINDRLLGSNFYRYRNTYFSSVGYGNFLYVPNTGAREAILAQVSKQAFSVKLEDCADLPEKTFEERAVYMDEAQETVYDKMMRENIAEFAGKTVIGVNELAKIMKTRQVTSGFFITDEGNPILLSRTKIIALKELLEEIPEGRQVLVFAQFHFEIQEIIKELGAEATAYYGDMNDKKKQESLDLWMSGKKRVLVAHPKTGGVGLNLQQANYMIWFSLSYSQEEFTQANARIWRQGQKNRCVYFVLLAKRKEAKLKKDRLIDEIIYEAVLNKKDMMNVCLDILKN